MTTPPHPTNPETRVASYFAAHEPAMARLGKALRAKLQKRLAGMVEVVYVYDTRKSLVISYSPTGNGYDGVCSLALEPQAVKLHFGQGARLAKSDPDGLLQGRGRTVRHVELKSASDLDRPEIERLMAAALTLAKPGPGGGATGSVVIKAEAQKQRAARRKQGERSPRAARKKPVGK